MIVHDCVQGTTEWAWLRAGMPTASNFDKIITPKGAVSTQAEKYMFKLLAERIMCHPCEEFKSSWMDRGQQTEGEAVAFYEMQRDVDTVKIGFVTNDTETIGASPDRLVGNVGLLEIKCPSEAVHVSYLLQAGSAYSEYRVQVQGQLVEAVQRAGFGERIVTPALCLVSPFTPHNRRGYLLIIEVYPENISCQMPLFVPVLEHHRGRVSCE